MACAGGAYVVLDLWASWFPAAQRPRDYRALDIDSSSWARRQAALACVALGLTTLRSSARERKYVAEDFASRREPGDTSRFLGKPKVAAWAIVVVLMLIAFVGFGTLSGRANTATHDSASTVIPTHDARCPDLRVPVLDRCPAQRPNETEGLPASP
jgi:hypothetical protein